MDHPMQSNTQMFRRGLDNAGFQQVLALIAHKGSAANIMCYDSSTACATERTHTACLRYGQA